MWKMDHPCFFDFFRSNRAVDGFRPSNDSFSLFLSADTFSVLCNGSSAYRQYGIHHCSKHALSNIACTCKKQNRTIDK